MGAKALGLGVCLGATGDVSIGGPGHRASWAGSVCWALTLPSPAQKVTEFCLICRYKERVAYAHSLGRQRVVPHHLHVPSSPGHPVCPLLAALRAALGFGFNHVTSPGTTFWQTFQEGRQSEKRGDAKMVS